ncbi:hypothetical protein [Pandoraea pnomenusa]|uniref:hypothetical protein n=1 Tax=Pandoraea pnomenusa TaxID=93220 RepID=UPI00333F7B37
MIKISSETRLKLKAIAGYAVLGSFLAGLTYSRGDLPYDPRDIGAIIGAALSALWLFRPR